MTSYSAFFSSGLLAPRTSLDVRLPKTSSLRDPTRSFSSPSPGLARGGDSSPIRPVSPLPPTHSEPDDIMDVESSPSSSSSSSTSTLDFARESTPTQHSVSAALALAHQQQLEQQQGRHNRSTSAVSTSSTTSNSGGAPNANGAGAAPRTLRKRRSSLTLGTSPLTAIRSPVQNVGAALKLQRHLGGGGRSRSGSTTAPLDGAFPSHGHVHGYGGVGMGVAEGLVGRLRSGSVGSGLHYGVPPVVRGNRRHVRRTTSVPAPVPPPSSPLPALPSLPVGVALHQHHKHPSGPAGPASRQPFAYQNKSDAMGGASGFKGASVVKGRERGMSVSGRERGLSVSAGVGRIEEEMKEN